MCLEMVMLLVFVLASGRCRSNQSSETRNGKITELFNSVIFPLPWEHGPISLRRLGWPSQGGAPENLARRAPRSCRKVL